MYNDCASLTMHPLAALSAHAPASSWEGGGVIPWSVERMRMQPGDVALASMLELLTVLAQVRGPVPSDHTRVHACHKLCMLTSIACLLASMPACAYTCSGLIRMLVLCAMLKWPVLFRPPPTSPPRAPRPTPRPLLNAILT